jgi:hypothetical protein
MPRVHLEISAALENCRKVTFAAPYKMDVRQTGGAEERLDVEIDDGEQADVFGSKGTVNFKMKWDKRDKHEATCTIVSQSNVLESRAWTKIATFDVRGLDLARFHPTVATVVSASGLEFEHADVADPDGFSEYDEDAQQPVSVSDIEWRFVAA